MLGCGDELELAMDLGLRLAVDVSHLHLQRAAGVLPASVERRLREHPRVEEIHVSANDGRSDRHALLQPDTPGLDWARARLADLPVVLESYWHRIDFDAQRRQLDLLRGVAVEVRTAEVASEPPAARPELRRQPGVMRPATVMARCSREVRRTS